MHNINIIESDKLFYLIQNKSRLTMSFQLFACFDIINTFRHLSKFEAKDVKYELLIVYSESVIERSLRLLMENGFLSRESKRYSVVMYVYNN
jgi:hypothetical protein